MLIRMVKTPNMEHMLTRRQSNRNSHSLLVGMQNGIAALEDNLFWASSESWWWARSLACCGPRGHKESGTTEQVNWTEPYSRHATRSSCSLVFTQMSWKLMSTQTPAHRFHSSLAQDCPWKQPRSPSTDERINSSTSRWWNISYSALRRNELSNHEKTWGKLKGRLLNQINPLEKVTYCMAPTIGHPEKAKLWTQ